MEAARRLLPAGQEIVVYKNNSDGKGNSYGCHENYLVDRNVPFASLVRNLIPWFVTRQVFTGAGKVGAENGADACEYQISQRADFFEEEVGLETTLKRPIVNTRDEPHADPQKYRRLHVIVGDANLCEVATFLKVGTTAIVLAMIEDGFIDKDLSISAPVAAIKTVSHDPTLQATVDCASLGRCTSIELQWEFLRLARKYADEVGARVLRTRGDRDDGARSLGVGVVRARVRPVVTRRSARLGDEARAAAGVRRARHAQVEQPEARAALGPVSRRASGPVACTRSSCVEAASNGSSTTTRSPPRWPIRPNRPARISGAPAWRDGQTRSWPPTGTAWCSTWESSPCEGSR